MPSQPRRSYKGQTQLTQPQLETGLNVHGTNTHCFVSEEYGGGGGEKLNEMGKQKSEEHLCRINTQGS